MKMKNRGFTTATAITNLVIITIFIGIIAAITISAVTGAGTQYQQPAAVQIYEEEKKADPIKCENNLLFVDTGGKTIQVVGRDGNGVSC